MKVLLLGCGNMGGAMLQACLPLLENIWQEVWVLRMAENQRRKLERHSDYSHLASKIHLASTFIELDATEQQFDLIILGMKPQIIREQMENCILFDNNSLWFTMAAGLPLSWYKKYKPNLRILRIMPNLGAQVGQGANLFYKEPTLTLNLTEQLSIEQLTQNIGVSVWCDKETQLDNATVVTGSGPAYFYLLTEALQLELEKQGFSLKQASTLAEASFLGAAAYLADMQEFDQPNLAGHLREAVTSKAGITEAALSVLSPQLMASFAEAVVCGIERNEELYTQLALG